MCSVYILRQCPLPSVSFRRRRPAYMDKTTVTRDINLRRDDISSSADDNIIVRHTGQSTNSSGDTVPTSGTRCSLRTAIPAPIKPRRKHSNTSRNQNSPKVGTMRTRNPRERGTANRYHPGQTTPSRSGTIPHQ